MNRKCPPIDDPTMRRSLLLCLAPLALSLGCGSSSPTCKETAHLYDIQHSSPTGLSGKALADHAVGVHQVELSLIKSPTGETRVAPVFPDKTPGTLTISMVPGAQWSHIISEYVPCSSHNCADVAVSCSDYYTVPVKARLTAFNGSIDESWEGELRAADPNDPDSAGSLIVDPHGGVASVSMARDSSSFLGNFKVAPMPARPQETITGNEILLSASFKGGKVTKAEILERVESEHQASKADAPKTISMGPIITLAPVVGPS